MGLIELLATGVAETHHLVVVRRFGLRRAPGAIPANDSAERSATSDSWERFEREFRAYAARQARGRRHAAG